MHLTSAEGDGQRLITHKSELAVLMLSHVLTTECSSNRGSKSSRETGTEHDSHDNLFHRQQGQLAF